MIPANRAVVNDDIYQDLCEPLVLISYSFGIYPTPKGLQRSTRKKLVIRPQLPRKSSIALNAVARYAPSSLQTWVFQIPSFPCPFLRDDQPPCQTYWPIRGVENMDLTNERNYHKLCGSGE